MSKRRISSDYLGPVMTDLDRYVEKTVAALLNLEFDAIAFRGNSGALIAPIIAHVMKKDLILIRKEGSHSNSKLEGRTDDGVRYVIVDDFVVTGGTLHEIQKVIKHNITDAVCVGVYLYQEDKHSFGDVNNKFKAYMRLNRIIGPMDELSDDADHIAAAKEQAEMIRKSIEEADNPTVEIMIERTAQGYADPLSPDPNVELKTVRLLKGSTPPSNVFFEKARQMGKTLAAAEQMVTEGVEQKIAVDFENQPSKRPWDTKARTFAEMYSPNFGRAMEPPKANPFSIDGETIIIEPRITPVELKRLTEMMSVDPKLDERFLSEARRHILQIDSYFGGSAERRQAIRKLYGEKVADDIDRIERAGQRLKVVRPPTLASASTSEG